MVLSIQNHENQIDAPVDPPDPPDRGKTPIDALEHSDINVKTDKIRHVTSKDVDPNEYTNNASQHTDKMQMDTPKSSTAQAECEGTSFKEILSLAYPIRGVQTQKAVNTRMEYSPDSMVNTDKQTTESTRSMEPQQENKYLGNIQLTNEEKQRIYKP